MNAAYVGMFYGRRTYLTAQVRAMSPSPEFRRLQSPALVADLDRWMADFFGYKELVPDGQVLVNDLAGTLHMNANTYRKLRENTDWFIMKGVKL